MKWEQKKIEDICLNITSGGTPKSTNEAFYTPQEIPWLKTGEVNYCRIYDTEKYISKEGLYNSSAKIIPTNSVIVAMYGQGDTAGRVAINKIPLTTNQACCNLIINDKVADYEFVYYMLSTLYEKMVSLKNGGAQPNLNAKIIKSIEISLPPLPIQQRIASILSAYDDLIENNQKQIKLLEEAAQRLYKEWFVDLRFPGYEGVKMVDGVPEGWSRKQIFELGKIITGKTPDTSKKIYYDGNIPFVKIPDMHNCIYTMATESTLTKLGADKQKNNYIPKNSIMVSCIGTVGLVNISSELCQTNQQINSIVLNNAEDVYYLFFSMKRLKALLDGVGSNGATMTNVNKTKFSSVEVLYSSSFLRKKYFTAADPLFKKIFCLTNQISSLREARNRFLPKLMSGEIEVEDTPPSARKLASTSP